MVESSGHRSLVPGHRSLLWRENWRTFRLAAWLGWQVEGNWADPFVFVAFTILRPLATALMLVVMYQVIAGGSRPAFFTYLYVSNAFFVVVIQTMAGLAWSIFDDRENYKMLKYIYTSPARQFAYLLGRALAKVLIGLFTTLVLLATGALFLGLPLHLEQIAWGWLGLYFVCGLAILAGFGIILAGVALVIARHGETIGEVTAGLLLLCSGAYFPPDILPPGLQQITLALPVTYWLEGMRRALTGGILQGTSRAANGTLVSGPISPLLAQLDNGQLLLILAVSAVVSSAGAYVLFHRLEHVAKEWGMIDATTGY